MKGTDKLGEMEKIPDKNESFYLKLRANIQNWMNKQGGALNKWGDLLMTAPDLFYLLWKLSIDAEVPMKTKGILAAAIVYFISPIDLLPEALFGPLGYLDDIALTALVLNMVINDTSPQLVRKFWAGEHDILLLIKNILVNADRFLGRGLWGRLRRRLG